MTNLEQTEATAQKPRPGRLERVGAGRLHGGVCRGLAEYTGYDVGLFRLGAIALTILGAAGIPIYLAAWLLIPERGAEQSIAERVWASRDRRPIRVYAAALVAIVVLACSPHAIVVGAVLVAVYLLWRATRTRHGPPQARRSSRTPTSGRSGRAVRRRSSDRESARVFRSVRRLEAGEHRPRPRRPRR